jgi:uncharacterized protein YjfI (DUF2170 family)
MLHPIREIAHFMDWADLYVAFEVRLLISSYFCPVHELGKNERRIAQFVIRARVMWPVHKVGNFTDGV